MESNKAEESKRIFLHHIDEFEMHNIKQHLMEPNSESPCSKYELSGSINQQEKLGDVMHGHHPLDIFIPTNTNYIQKIMNCDILVFNLNSANFESVYFDIRRVMTSLEKWSNEKRKSPESMHLKKHLILISTPMTWALTPVNPSSTIDEEDNSVTGFLREEDYRRRKAHINYNKHKLIERDVIWLQKKCKSFVKTLVVCPGITFGAENDKFHYIFKLAFYNKPVPILKPGSQNIPIIYIKDFVKIMKSIIDNFPQSKVRHIFAVNPTLISLKSITYHICKSFNGNCSNIRFCDVYVPMLEKELFSQSVLDVLSLNVKMSPTYFKDFEFHEMTNSFWDQLASEFRDARLLRPLRVVLDGPPLVGKTYYAKQLSEFYQLNYIDIRTIMNEYIKYLEKNIKNGTEVVETYTCTKLNEKSNELNTDEEDLMEELKCSIKIWNNELFELKMYIAGHNTFEDQEFEQVSRCLIGLISNKEFNDNQGYLIDGFPFTYAQANQIFYNTRTTDLNFDQSNSENTTPLTPTHCILFDAHDELLCNRAMGLPETEAIMRRCLRHQMLPRLDAYRERNEELQCLADLFYDNDIIPISIFIEQDTLPPDTLRMIKAEIGPPFIYPLSSEQQKAQEKLETENRALEEKEKLRLKEELVKSLTLDRESKLSKWTSKYEELRKHEAELLEVKTLPIRQYLGKYVLPTLTEGILKIAELKPDDPVDFLAEYLFKCNPEGQQLPPFCTDDQRKHFYESCCDSLPTDSVNDTRRGDDGANLLKK